MGDALWSHPQAAGRRRSNPPVARLQPEGYCQGWIGHVVGDRNGPGGSHHRAEDRSAVLSSGAFEGARYAFIDNHSNSAGYGFRSHRFNFLVARTLGCGFDGQVFFTTQLRRYDEGGAEPIPSFLTAEDEYEQSVRFDQVVRPADRPLRTFCAIQTLSQRRASRR